MYQVREGTTGALLAARLRPAHTHWTRLKGLLGTRNLPPGEGLWLKPCNQVHMLGMRYAVDVVFLDGEHRVLQTINNLRPWRLSPRVKAAASVLELPVGTLERSGLRDGAGVEIEGEPEPLGLVDTAGVLVCNLVLGAIFALFAYVHYRVAWTTGQWLTTAPLVAQESLATVLFVLRRVSRATSSRPLDWLLGMAGTVLPLFFRPTDNVSSLHWLGEPLQVSGLCVAVIGLFFLGRSFALIAGNRGIKTRGGYRLVRHPIYSGYFLGQLGYVLSYPTLRNCLIAAASFASLGARATVEERFLKADPAYVEYMRRTPWRFVPYVY